MTVLEKSHLELLSVADKLNHGDTVTGCRSLEVYL